MDSGGGGGASHKAASGSTPSVAAAAAANPTAMLSALMSKRAKLQEELRSIERQVYEMETTYLQESNQFGSVLKGFESFLSSSKNTSNLKRSRKFQADERLFSLSSVTSPAVDEHMTGRDGTDGSLGLILAASWQMEENMDQVVQKAQQLLQTGKENQRREGAREGETAREYDLRMIQTWTTKMTSN
uniref:Chromatin modification-related protein MEAF6 n=1 Tax=Leersia perrieri TaxID=77586 RepID=A0A0D9VK06_9ORYZ